jgi:peroxiredoxin
MRKKIYRTFTQVLLTAGTIALMLSCGNSADTPKTGKYHIKATVGGVADGTTVYLQSMLPDGGWTSDSTTVKDRCFEFSDAVDEPFLALIRIAGDGETPDMRHIFIEKGEIILTSDDSIKNATVQNSQLNKDFDDLNEAMKLLEAKANALNEKAGNASPEQQQSAEFREELNRESKVLQDEYRQLVVAFIKSHPASYISLMLLTSFVPDDIEFADSVFTNFPDELKQTKTGKDLSFVLEGNKKTAVGAVAPDFTMNTPDGVPVKLSDFRGKYLLLDFWASWCGPCRQENPNVVEAYQRFKDRNFTILGVSLDNEQQDGKERWLKAIADDKLEWTQVSDLKYWDNAAAKLYAVRSIPANFLLDPDGKIIARDLRGDELLKKLEETLK